VRTQYRDVNGFPGYRVGDDGSVWSCRKVRQYKWGQWRRLKSKGTNKYGYQAVTLMRDGIVHDNIKVPHLVLEAFVGPRPLWHEALHGDGNARNNALSNLRWGTKTENGLDTRRHGSKKGERHGMAKLTDELVRTIRHRVEAGESQSAISRSIGVSQPTISLAVRRRQWGHVQ